MKLINRNRIKSIKIKVEITNEGNLSIQTISNLGYGWTETNMILIPKDRVGGFINKLNKLYET